MPQRATEMRSVNKGALPQDESGEACEFKKYQDAAPYLHARLGRYCSYCERFIAANLAVEHKLPKSIYPDLECDWMNFLLACANCNSNKLDKVGAPLQGLWPDTGDTFSVLEYAPTGAIRPKEGLPEPVAEAAQALLNLVGLDKSPRQAANTDFRWQDRYEVWSIAQQSLKDLKGADTSQMRDRIIDVARSRGGFSVWMSVFHGDSDMKARLIACFPGTRMDSPPTPTPD